MTFILAINVAHIPFTIFAIIGTTVAVGIGLGSQNITNNFISGLIILIERPIEVGDTIEISSSPQNIIGQVKNIGTRCTSILTEYSRTVLVPNSRLLQEVVINHSHEKDIIKACVNIQINNHVDVNEIDKKILKILRKQSLILQNPSPIILYQKILRDVYDIDIEFYFDYSAQYRADYIIKNDIHYDMKRYLDSSLQDKASYISSEVNRDLAEMLREYN